MLPGNDDTLEAVMDDLRPHIARQIDMLRERGFPEDVIIAAYRERLDDEKTRTHPY